LGELARMYSKIGRMTELSSLLDSTKDRDLAGTGHATDPRRPKRLVDDAEQARLLFSMRTVGLGQNSHAHRSLQNGQIPPLMNYNSTTNGFTLPQVAGIVGRLGMNYQMAFRSPGAALSCRQSSIGRSAILPPWWSRRNDRFLAQDFTFRGSVWMTTNALEKEASGYFLVPPGPLPKGWRTVSTRKASPYGAKGRTGGETTDGNGTSIDKTCGGTSCNKNTPCTSPAA
jgi:hypothetical protein